jgi:hypothetical protein
MSDQIVVQWSSKFKKFGINDPFLQLITIKYEKQIQWQVKVKNEDTFNAFIREFMLPELLNKTIWDPNAEKSTKSLFIHFSSINPEASLENDVLTPDEKNSVKEHLKKINKYKTLFENGDVNSTFNEFKRECRRIAAQYIATIFNKRKAESYENWVTFLNKKFKNNFGFHYLILKPLIEQSGYNSRRSISLPDEAVLKWLYVRIENRFYKPSVNLMQEYRFRLVQGLKGNVINGWQYIPSGTSNTSILTAASFNSGWCIAGRDMAYSYLKDYFFYILKKNHRPVVAIRVRNTRIGLDIVEIRGVHNSVPLNYYPEIWFFVKIVFPEFSGSDLSQKSVVASLPSDFCDVTLKNIEQNEQNVSWWQDKLDLWPGTYDFIPDAIKSSCVLNTENYITNSFYWSLGTSFWAKYGIKFSEEDYLTLLIQFPQFYNTILDKENETYKNACITGVVNRLKFEDITLKEYKELPDFIKNSRQVAEQLQKKLPQNLIESLTKRPKNREERNENHQLAHLRAFKVDEEIEITITRLLEYIVKNDSSDFSDIIFPEEIRKHSKFEYIREQAWLKAVIKNPTFYFAFPVDLIQKNIWRPQTIINEKYEEMLKKWVQTIETRPWYLEIENKVPKSVRYHESLLRAYLRGWIKILEKTPYYMWKKVNPYQRVYMSYAAFRNFHIFNTIAHSSSFKSGGRAYRLASGRMFEIPAFQLAILYAGVIFDIPKHEIQQYIKPLYPESPDPTKADPQRSLIARYKIGPMAQFVSMICKINVPENYYFNRIDPNIPYVPKVKFGSRIELEINGQVQLFSFGVQYPDFELIEKESPEAKILLGKFEGDEIPELNMKIKGIY